MTDQADKIIAEALGVHVHRWMFVPGRWKNHYMCEDCLQTTVQKRFPEIPENEYSFSTWPGFGLIMEIGPSRDWWRSFIQWWWRDVSYGYAMMAPSSAQEPFEILLMREFNPTLFSGKLVEFLRERRNKINANSKT